MTAKASKRLMVLNGVMMFLRMIFLTLVVVLVEGVAERRFSTSVVDKPV